MGALLPLLLLLGKRLAGITVTLTLTGMTVCPMSRSLLDNPTCGGDCPQATDSSGLLVLDTGNQLDDRRMSC